MNRFRAIALAWVAASLALRAAGAPPADDIEANLARVPRVWEKAQHQLTYAEYESTLKYWAAQHPSLATLQKRGESHEGLGVFLLKVTDAAVPDENKQVCLVSALHGGAERSGTTATMHLIEWLLGDSPEAVETRRKQVVLFLPIPNPHGYFVTDQFRNAENIDVYNAGPKWWDLKTLKLTAPDKTPELAALVGVIDEYQPEVHVDLHGVGQQSFTKEQLPDRRMFEGHTMFEVSGLAYSNDAIRPWDSRVTEAMVRAGQEAGYGSDRAEADAQRMFWGPSYEALSDRTWTGRPQFYSGTYGYAKFHTMIATNEIGWEESGVARVRGLLRLGNAPWLDEQVAGYPVNRMKSFVGHFITTYGTTAAERRRSRAELWPAQGVYAQGTLYPQFSGRDTYVCAVTAAGRKALDTDLGKFVANLRALPGMRADVIEKFVQAGPEHMLALQAPAHVAEDAGAPVMHGIGFRCRIPYRHPELLDVRVNGVFLPPSPTDGYQSWWADGFTQLQINIPPEKARKADVFVVTCAYRPDVERHYGWTPPTAVLEQLNSPAAKP